MKKIIKLGKSKYFYLKVYNVDKWSLILGTCFAYRQKICKKNVGYMLNQT
jgi:hypothetical protein